MNYSNINMTNCPFLNISLELKKYHINIYIYKRTFTVVWLQSIKSF